MTKRKTAKAGHRLPAKYTRSNLARIPNTVRPGIDLHIARLVAAHPELNVRIDYERFGSLSDATKQLLLNDLNAVLGIKPLKRNS